MNEFEQELQALLDKHTGTSVDVKITALQLALASLQEEETDEEENQLGENKDEDRALGSDSSEDEPTVGT